MRKKRERGRERGKEGRGRQFGGCFSSEHLPSRYQRHPVYKQLINLVSHPSSKPETPDRFHTHLIWQRRGSSRSQLPLVLSLEVHQRYPPRQASKQLQLQTRGKGFQRAFERAKGMASQSCSLTWRRFRNIEGSSLRWKVTPDVLTLRS